MAMLTTAVGRAAASPGLARPRRPGCCSTATTWPTARAWYIFLSGFLEPVFYLFSIGVGVGQLVTGFEFNGEPIPYAEFVAPGMLAASAMNGSMLDSTFNFFFKLKYNKLFDQMLATPLTTDGHRPRRAALVAAARRHLLRGVPAGDGRDGPGRVLVGGAGAAGGAADRLRLRRRRAWR